MDALIVALMAWASILTGLPVPEQKPIVDFLPAERLFHTLHPGAKYHPEIMRVDGVYRNGFIYLKEGFDPSSVVDQSALLHELVHHLQAHSEHADDCLGDKERVAYEAQEKFLNAGGLDIEKDFGTTRLFMALIFSNCGLGFPGR